MSNINNIIIHRYKNTIHLTEDIIIVYTPYLNGALWKDLNDLMCISYYFVGYQSSFLQNKLTKDTTQEMISSVKYLFTYLFKSSEGSVYNSNLIVNLYIEYVYSLHLYGLHINNKKLLIGLNLLP